MSIEVRSRSGSKPDFSVRITVCDHYLSKPIPGLDVIYSDFRGSDIKQVPILRVFGPTPDGHKACLHIHGVFPYFYIPCPTANPEPQFMYQIAASLDKALNIALKQATSAQQHVYKISLVKGLPFYGFHDKDHLYLKVFLYNPGLIKQAVELCSNSAILGQPFQPHESHLNFTLQFFIDFNLFGMSNIDLQTVSFRKTGLSQDSNEPVQSPDGAFLKPESSCFYEADCVACHIVNRQRIGKGDGIENPGLEEVWNQEKERRRQLNMSMASKSLSQGRIKADETESHYKYEQMFLIKMSNDLNNPVKIENETKEDKERVYYPAESMEGSQLFDAVDVSIHLPDQRHYVSLSETFRKDLDETLVEDADDTIVDENVALNCSLHYSQVLFNSEDLELVHMLQDMDEQPVEEDSVMCTPAAEDKEESEIDDMEYSQVFNEETVLMEIYKSNDGNESSWNDSFWEGANIPQLDGTFDDDHVKKVRKRKMRPLKLGLSRPQKKVDSNQMDNVIALNINADLSEGDEEINASRETIDSISSLHLKKVVKTEPQSFSENYNDIHSGESIVDLVDKISIKQNNKSNVAELYDFNNKFEPEAGPSKVNIKNNEEDDPIKDSNDSTFIENSIESSFDNKQGIMSFYDMSKVFDMSLQNNDCDLIDDETENENMGIEKINLNFAKNSNYTNEIKTEVYSKTIITPKIRPPTKNYILTTLEKYEIPKVINLQPFFSDHKDVGDKVEIGQMILKLQSNLSRDQKPLGRILDTTSIEEWRQLLFMQTNELSEDSAKPDALKLLLAGNRNTILQAVKRPLTKVQVLKEIEENKVHNKVNFGNNNEISKNLDDLENSQAIGLNEDEINSSISLETEEKQNETNTLQVTMQPDGSFLCFGGSENQKEDTMESPAVDVDFLTVMLTEVHTSVRGELHPDPLLDPIQAVFIMITNDCPPDHFLSKSITQIIGVDNVTPKILDRCIFNTDVTYVNNENELLELLIEIIKKHDPDIMCGYEIEMNSWGYILERAQILGLEMVREISRITEKHRQKKWRGQDNEMDGKIIGRITFNVWRLFRHELALSSYSFENCMYEVLKERVPKYSYKQLAKWWSHESRILRWIPVEYYMTRLTGTVRMMEKLDIINRTSELARLFGLQWWEVLSRGSQFRVESLMLRAARPLNLIALSPTVKQRSVMRAPECLPLIFEPESRFYSDPVIVLDFQSLYPSMMIAYNYCFSTCIGRVQHINGDSAYEFGAWRLRIPKAKLEALVKNGHVHWSPVGVGFVKSAVRRGVLPALLRRILAARQAVKKSMKMQTDEAVKKAMHSRQLGLKLIANVTYGYTAANFSGRMPCVEVADSVVSKGRETLERAIQLVRKGSWNAKVVYGDTDSMFVVVPGGTRAEAFAVGQQIADAVTADNPSPVALKLEKVYQPCILQTKKRYVGYMYESPDQETPVYEAKGIETVRRDGCPAGVKLLHRALCELFSTGDMSRVKRSVVSLLSRLADDSLPIQDLFFSREYHGPNGYRPGAVAVPNEIAKRIAATDRRAVPRPGWRVRWLVSAGAPCAPLVKLSRSPEELSRSGARPHVLYYATRVLLPPLHRCLSLLGVDVLKWWCELGYGRTANHHRHAITSGIARYMWRYRCAICGARGNRAVCADCSRDKGAQPVAAAMAARLNIANTHLRYCAMICSSCTGHTEPSSCDNTECPVLWRRVTAQEKLDDVRDVVTNLPAQFCRESLNF
ncbi:DNA polymerase zeta catalytic subunit [Amyelois transitella]|uniref:DNA polymerase zeta catalytic subunit n=1 Tax=Amyelois transitella TaxID=680683 RepID=UPI00298F7995|nr:DNA polymerase zeta catalytic subunit [Amyelois transitella]